MKREEQRFTISVLAKRAGVSAYTVLYYERRGLLATTRRSAAGYRLYSNEAVRRIGFIRHMQKLEFSLKEIQELLTTYIAPGVACDGLHDRLRAKVDDLSLKLQKLGAARESLENLVVQCEKGRPLDECIALGELRANGTFEVGAEPPRQRRKEATTWPPEPSS